MVCCKVACFDQNGFNAEEILKQGEDIKMSTKRHVYESRRGVNTKKMQRAMRNVTIQHAANPGVAPARNSTLDEELQCKYSGKVLFRPHFEDFLRDEAAIRDEWLKFTCVGARGAGASTRRRAAVWIIMSEDLWKAERWPTNSGGFRRGQRLLSRLWLRPSAQAAPPPSR